MSENPRIQTTEAPPKDVNFQLEQMVAKQRRIDTVQSLIASVILILLIAGGLWLIAILPGLRESDVIVTYQPPPPEEENPVERPDMAIGMKPKPTSASSSMARVIAAAVEAPVAVPVPEESVPTAPFGVHDDFSAGFGAGDGDGDGGGGSSFFGTPRTGKRVAYLVDFSGSMASDAPGGGTRLDSLKAELVRSIEALKPSMTLTVIFFAQSAWTIETEPPNEHFKGWNGLNEVPPVPWHQASERIKGVYQQRIQSMALGNGTVWYSPLKMALSMSPPPDIIYLLSDGEPSDFEDVLFRIDEMNPNGIPIDTIALEEPGKPARAMHDLAQETGGTFTMVYEGEAIRGRAAEKYLNEDW